MRMLYTGVMTPVRLGFHICSLACPGVDSDMHDSADPGAVAEAGMAPNGNSGTRA